MWLLIRLMMLGCAIVPLLNRRSYGDAKPAVESFDSSRKQAKEPTLVKTLGGRQFWGDVHNFRGWRIQQNVFTKHYRLIDPSDSRHTWGSFEVCDATLKKIREEKKLAPPTGSAVIMIHGLLQSSKSMTEMGTALRNAGYSTIEFSYPSTQISIPEAARFLDRLIQSLEGIDEINFVAHSMGGLIVRSYILDYDDPRIKRMVMLGTPNRGSELADITEQYWIVRTAAGPSVRQLGTRSDGLIPRLPVPKFEFAVIAGSRGTSSGWNPLIPGDDDGTVTVASTRLSGAADFATVRALHSRLLRNEEVLTQTVNFLKDGRLRTEGETQPIGMDEVPRRSNNTSTGGAEEPRR